MISKFFSSSVKPSTSLSVGAFCCCLDRRIWRLGLSVGASRPLFVGRLPTPASVPESLLTEELGLAFLEIVPQRLENAGSWGVKLTHQRGKKKKQKKTHTRRARNRRAYQPVVIEPTRIVQKTLGREEMNLREGGTHRAERRGGGGSRSSERPRRAPRWWEDGRRGREAGLPVPSAAADFREGRRGQAALPGAGQRGSGR